MKNEIYQPMTVKDGMSDTAGIIKVFTEMATGRLSYDLNLLNYYDEVPIGYGSTITAVGKDSLELAIHEHQALIIKHNNSTLIRCKHFFKGLDVHCYAAYVNVSKKTVILHNFSYAQIRAARREAVRVKVHGTLPVTFNYGNNAIEGSMVDISVNGMSIESGAVPTTTTDQPGELNFTLNGTPLEVPGSFVTSVVAGTGKISCMFKMQPDRTSDRIIGQFIYQRQVKIIQQLKDGLLLE